MFLSVLLSTKNRLQFSMVHTTKKVENLAVTTRLWFDDTIAISALSASFIIPHPTNESGIIFFTKNSQEILLDLDDFAL